MSKDIRIYSKNEHYHDGVPALWTSMESDDVSIMYYSKSKGDMRQILLRSLIEVYEERMEGT
jgi:hypothetical protein